jgi:hypothetical protein
MKNTDIATARLQLHISAMDLVAAYNCNWSRDSRDKRIAEAEEIFLNFEKAFVRAVFGFYPRINRLTVRQRADHYSTREFATRPNRDEDAPTSGTGSDAQDEANRKWNEACDRENKRA